MDQHIRILILEDNPPDAELLVRELRRAGFAPEWNRVETRADFLAALESGPDMIISDFSLPQFNGTQAVQLVRERGLDTPFILVSGTLGEEAAVESMKHGADDYLLKDRIARLGPAIQRVLNDKQVRKERAQAEQSLRESEERFRQVVESIHEVFWVTTAPKTRMLYVSPAYETIWGRSCASLYESPGTWLDAIHSDDRARVAEAADAQQAEGKYNETYRIVRPDGSVRWIEDRAFPIRNAEGSVYRVAGVAEDITKRKVSEMRRDAQHTVTRALAGSESLNHAAGIVLEVLCRNLSWDVGALWIQEARPKCLRCVEIWHEMEPRFAEFACLSRECSFAFGEGLPGGVWKQGEPAWIADVSKDPSFQRTEWAAAAGLRGAFAFPVKRRGETVGVIEFLSAEVRPPDEESLLMFDGISSQLGQFIDRKQIERQFQQSQKMEAFGQLAGGVAHDFNNLLAVIMGYASLLTDEELPAGAKNLVGHIYTAGEKAANLTRQLLTFSRKKEIKLSPLNLNSVIANVTKMLGRIIGEDVRLHCSYSPNLPSIQGDDGMMEQVLMNLAVNARDAMPKGGELTISTAVQTLSPDDLPAIPEVLPGDFVRLTVRDNGCGMSPEIKERIFEPFFTTKEVGKGTGLGLATVFGIVKEHQGWVEVESEVGAGAAFKLFFPVHSQPVAAVDSRPAFAIRPGHETILIVEDDHAVREMTKRILARHGYHVLEATSGTQAIAVWEKHKHQIRLLLTDIIMPGGIAGPELARELKSRDPKLKVIYSSGYSAYSPSTLEQGDDAIFIQKPFDPRQLAESVRRSLDSWK